MPDAPSVLALDFDGVLCDGRPEYFESARRTYAAAWPGPRAPEPAGVAARFAALRPLIESGWEMPVLYHVLAAGVPDAALPDRGAWLATAHRVLGEAGVDAGTLGGALNTVRDEWFARDPAGWLAHHAFYPGVASRVESLLAGSTRVVVVTTKAERFVRALLAAQRPALARLPIIGREPARAVPKADSLRRLVAAHALPAGGAGLWFVEDMLETLETVRRTPDLDGARLFLAAWGYNTLEDRAAAALRSRMAVLSLAGFTGDWTAWG